jgi:hypothetical protein
MMIFTGPWRGMTSTGMVFPVVEGLMKSTPKTLTRVRELPVIRPAG